MARFGKFQTGVSIQAPVFVPKNNRAGCLDDFEFEQEMADKYDLHMKGFVLLEDGVCTYEAKARNVQRMGAQAVLIAQDHSEYIDHREHHQS